jgi:hypothetical protein
MKKLFALLLAVGALSTTFAQDHSRDDRDRNYGYPNGSVYNNSNYSSREKDSQIERINYEFARKIEFVRNDNRLRRRDKKREISFLENQRDQQIQETIAGYSNRNGRYDNRYARNNGRH